MIEEAAPQRHRREVVSFVRRSARMRPHQRLALDTHGAAYVLEVPRGASSTSVAPGPPLDLRTVFGREAPLVVEIGPGTGESLVPMAAARPDVDVLVFEVYEPAVARLVAGLADAVVDTVRVVQGDAADGFRHLLPDASVSEVWTFFPDPWPKTRHHKRRLVDPAFADLVASRCAPGGRWRLATDWPDYADWALQVLDGCAALEREPAERWSARPLTRFERRGLAAGRSVTDLTYRRR